MFAFLITYFKPSGKYYTTAVVEWDIAPLSNDPTQAYYHDAITKLRGLRDNGGQGALPGLSGEGWEGPILIEQAIEDVPFSTLESPDGWKPNGVPHLLMP